VIGRVKGREGARRSTDRDNPGACLRFEVRSSSRGLFHRSASTARHQWAPTRYEPCLRGLRPRSIGRQLSTRLLTWAIPCVEVKDTRWRAPFPAFGGPITKSFDRSATMPQALTKTRKKSNIPGAGFGFIGLMLSLLVVAIGGGIGATVFFGGGSSSGSGSGSADASPVNRAYDTLAESTLETAESAVQTAATTSGYGSITAQSLGFDEPSVRFTSGASTNDTTVSVAGSSAGQSQSGIPGGPGDVDVPSGGGSVTLGVYSQSLSGPGSCLYVWMESGSTWFGAEADQSSCAAPALSAAPQPGAPTSSTIGWAQTTFPSP
jgi:hypothetical protein